MEELFYMLNAVYPLPDDLRDHLFEIVKLKDFSKGEFLLKAGQVCQNVYFVRTGLLRCFVKDKQEKEINTWFKTTVYRHCKLHHIISGNFFE